MSHVSPRSPCWQCVWLRVQTVPLLVPSCPPNTSSSCSRSHLLPFLSFSQSTYFVVSGWQMALSGRKCFVHIHPKQFKICVQLKLCHCEVHVFDLFLVDRTFVFRVFSSHICVCVACFSENACNVGMGSLIIWNIYICVYLLKLRVLTINEENAHERFHA